MIPVWMVMSGVVYMFSLPFSQTDYFDFNPDPTFAIVLSTLALPFLIPFILYTAFECSRRKFGIVSVTGVAFIIIHIATSIIPNSSLIQTIPFYILNIIPVVAADAILSLSRKRSYVYAAGALLGASFFTLYFPLITHVYNEGAVWPSLISSTYFAMISKVYPSAAGPAIMMGVLGIIIGSRFVSMLMLREPAEIKH
jgi:hypothetical protein